MVEAAEAGCSQTLLVSLWIRCMESATGQKAWGFGWTDQLMIDHSLLFMPVGRGPRPGYGTRNRSIAVDNQ